MSSPKSQAAGSTAKPQSYAPTRRAFVRDVAAGAAILATLPLLQACASSPKPAPSVDTPEHPTATRFGHELALPPLPYAVDALAPVISAETVTIHYERHHAGYAKKLAALVAAPAAVALGSKTLAGIIAETRGSQIHQGIFNSAGQLSNHNFYWQSLSPKKSEPNADLMALITRDFKTMDNLKAEMKAAALGQFGSGWAWLALRDGGLSILATADAENPLPAGGKPLLTLDVWEHAYYVDYHNDRGGHVQAVLDNLLNWDHANGQLRAG